MCLTMMNFYLKNFDVIDISEYFEQISLWQKEVIYTYHYPDKAVNELYIKNKVNELKKHIENNNSYFIAGFTKENIFSGYVWCYETLFLDQKRMIINSLYVEKNCRGKGLSAKLIEEVKRIAYVKNCKDIGVHHAIFNSQAANFYKKHGFLSKRIEMNCSL